MPASKRQYQCDCEKHCGGRQKVVSRATYYGHAEFRAKTSQTFADFVADLSGTRIFSHAASWPSEGNTSQLRGRKRARVENEIYEMSEQMESSTIAPSFDELPGPDMDCESPGLGPSTETSEFTPTCTLHLAHDHITLSDVDEHEDEDMDPGSIAATRGSEDAASSSQTRDDTRSGLGPETELEADRTATIEEIKIAEEFIRLLKQASLETSGLDANTIHRLHHPIEAPLDIDDPDLLLSIEIFLSVTNTSQATYTAVRGAILHRYPENTILTFDQVKSKIAELSGVVPIIQDMCVNTCLAYTGPFAELDQCPTCGEPRYDTTSNGKKRIARQEFHTIPVGPQLQALWRSREGATAMRHRSRRTHEILERLREHNNQLYEYDDVYHGSAYLKAVLENQISTDDMVLLMSIDGAQLYESKASDCWIYIWVVLDLAPELRYKKKHVLPGGFIPGPHKPKNLDSFLFPGLGHLMALQIADTLQDQIHLFHPRKDRTHPVGSFLRADHHYLCQVMRSHKQSPTQTMKLC
ncbi:hypothetical protein SCP_0214370 [Sparassis crispa]|uniref:Transposase family Tnp2 protein n=1 Tax=Sparassis crispa TaxID=139825 RepID=A0A401GDI4_9APHY|nr:hypothetical protein SCP_0214370 [Sparassis crispa]GBE80227.1 hypothetical protein SCP_0214370 [Sparassis crispa]